MRISRETFNRRVVELITDTKAEGGAVAVTPVLAALGRKYLFFMLTRLLHRKDIDKDWLYERCMDVDEQPDGMLDLWAREHYKSTIITYGLTIKDIMNDPETTAGIFSCTRPIAKAFLSQIRDDFQYNDLLKEVYSDVLWQNPRVEAPRWSLDNGITVKRKSNPKESTIEAWGIIDGQPTSKHFNRLIYDDVVTLESVTTPEMIEKVTERWAVSLNLGAHGGVKRVIGTRYHYNDTYRTMMERGAVVPRIFPATEDGTAEGKPVFIDKKALMEKRDAMGVYVFGCQMLQNPTADKAMGFSEKWLRYWQAKPEFWRKMNVYVLVDPSSGKKSQGSKGNDYTTMWVLGLGEDKRYYVIDYIRDRLSLTQREKKLTALVRLYEPIRVGYEEYGLQADIEHIQYVQQQNNFHYEIVPVGGKISKKDRILGLIPVYESGRMFLPAVLTYCDVTGSFRNLIEEFIEEEYKAFPVCAYDDGLDGQARILDPKLGAVFPDPNESLRVRGGYENGVKMGKSKGFDYDPLA